MSDDPISQAAIAVVRRNTEEVQGSGDFELFEQLFAQDFVDHPPSQAVLPIARAPSGSTTSCGQLSQTFMRTSTGTTGDLVTTYKTYHGTHKGPFLGVAPTGRKISFETVDAMRVRNGQIVEHWGVANLYKVLEQLGALPVPTA